MTGDGSGTSIFAGYSLLLDSPLSYDGGAVARSGVSEPLILDEEVTSIAFAADGKTFAVGGGLDAIVLWDLATLRQVSVLSTGEPVATWSLVFSPTMPPLLASGELHGMVWLWDISTGEQITAPLSGHKGPVSSLAFAPDGIRLASGSYDGTIRLWNVETGPEVGQPLAGHGQAIRGVAFQNREESPLLASSSSGSVILWDVEADHRMGSELADGDTSSVSSLVFAPGDTTISAPAPLAINLWDVQHPQRLVRSIELGLDAEHDPYSLASNPMDRRVLVSGGFDGTIAFWDARTGEMLGSPLPAHDGLVWSVAFSADGKLVASGGEDGSVRLWDVSTRTAIGSPITGYADQVDTVAFSRSTRTSWPLVGPTVVWSSGTLIQSRLEQHYPWSRGPESKASPSGPMARGWPLVAPVALSDCGTPPVASRWARFPLKMRRSSLPWPSARTAI